MSSVSSSSTRTQLRPPLVHNADVAAVVREIADLLEIRGENPHGRLDAIVDAARRAGLGYIAITDHSPGLRVAHGLDGDAQLRQGEEIARFNDTLTGFKILHGCEVATHTDGSLDLPDRVLRRLDVVVGAIRAGLDLIIDRQTTRILRALERPVFHLLAHPSCRLLSGRPGIEVDMERVLRQARARGCALEVNAQPGRLDLDDVWCRAAVEHGALLAVDSDAHSRYDFDDLDLGITQARRGWGGPGQVANTWPLGRLCKWMSACQI